MQPKLILVEGLPGSGKSTTATVIYDYLKNNHIPVELYVEGDIDHPADFDGVAVFSDSEFQNLLNGYSNFREKLIQTSKTIGSSFLVYYKKLKYEFSCEFPDELMDEFYGKDVYELPLKHHIQLITENWRNFAKTAGSTQTTYIFECCYIQNPVTTAFVKYNAPDGVALNYVQGLTNAVENLNPLLIYVDQKDIDYTFRKALSERSQVWADFFINYYTGQGFGLANGLKDVEGTIEVLKNRSKLEKKIFNSLDIEKIILDNSNYDKDNYQEQLENFLTQKYF